MAVVPSLSPAEQVMASGADPLLLPVMLRHRQLDIEAGIPWVLLSVRRSSDHQAELYERAEAKRREWERTGRVGPAPKPAAKPGTSKHELGMAYDRKGPRTPAEWERSTAHAEALGLEAGQRYNDPEHFELPQPFDHLRTAVSLRLAAVLAALGVAWAVVDGAS